MLTVMTILMIILAVLLILVVILQPGKGDMISGMGGLNTAFSSMVGNRQAANILQKITIGFAAAIIILSVLTNVFFVSQTGPAIEKAPTEGQTAPMQTAPTMPMPTQAPTK